jgi:hypothetical protein
MMMSVGPGEIVHGYRLLERLFPAPPLKSLTREPLEQLSRKYKRRDRWGNWLGFLAFVVMAVLYFFLLLGLSAWSRSGIVQPQHILHPFEVEHVCYALFLSLVSSTYFLVLILRWILGAKEYDLYMAYCGQRMPFHFHIGKAFRAFFLIFFLPLLIVAVLRVSMYTAFTERAMLDSPFGTLGIARQHPYADVRGVYLVRGYHGRFEDFKDPFYLIDFKDGFHWEVGRGSQSPRLDQEQAVVRYVAQQSGRPIREVQFAEDIPR